MKLGPSVGLLSVLLSAILVATLLASSAPANALTALPEGGGGSGEGFWVGLDGVPQPNHTGVQETPSGSRDIHSWGVRTIMPPAQAKQFLDYWKNQQNGAAILSELCAVGGDSIACTIPQAIGQTRADWMVATVEACQRYGNGMVSNVGWDGRYSCSAVVQGYFLSACEELGLAGDELGSCYQ